MCKCNFPDGLVIKPDGVNELDPCVYVPVQCFANVTVMINICSKCGNVDISWKRQDNTEEIEVE